MNAAAGLTYTGIYLAVFCEQLCLPVPAALALMSAGALAAQGDHHLNIALVLAGSILASLCADGIWFWMGRRWGSRIIRVLCSFTADPRRTRQRARATFDQWGTRLLVVAKFLPGINGVSPPLAGVEGITVSSFALYDGLGAALWAGAYILLGFLFATQIEFALRFLGQLGTLILVLAGVPIAVYALWRVVQLLRVLRHLRLHRISAEALSARLGRGEAIAVFDLLNFEAREGALPGIPGALRVDPERLRNAPTLVVPGEISIVLYCSSRNDLASARVARVLEKRLHTTNVWVLEGGLDAWSELGLPTTLDLATREEMAHRFGVELSPEMH
ncbi:MAG: VTT domain-containing protein [Acidobacteriaceae bacterium]|nr:VTT domain-containing protein [Acidobacteriaceae bacterium]